MPYFQYTIIYLTEKLEIRQLSWDWQESCLRSFQTLLQTMQTSLQMVALQKAPRSVLKMKRPVRSRFMYEY